jgi:hypothetical protein
MDRKFTPRGVLLAATAFGLAACSDDPPTATNARIPDGGAKTPAAVINILPPGTTFPAKIAFATGSPVGKEAVVRVYDKSGTQLAKFYAFSAAEDFSAGVEVAVGDVTGDGWPDIVAGEGPTPSASWSSQISVWDGKTGTLLKTIAPYPGNKDGYRVATGDLDGNGSAEILGCRMPGGTTHAVALRLDGSPVDWVSIYNSAYGWAKGGCDVDAGDINGDGKAEMIVKFDGVWNIVDIKDVANNTGFFVPSPLTGYTGSTSLTVGDVNGDKKPEIIMGYRDAVSSSPTVLAFDGRNIQPNKPLFQLLSFKPFSFWWKTGVQLAARDIHGDGQVELIIKPTVTPFSEIGALVPMDFTSWLFYFLEAGNPPAGGSVG